MDPRLRNRGHSPAKKSNKRQRTLGNDRIARCIQLYKNNSQQNQQKQPPLHELTPCWCRENNHQVHDMFEQHTKTAIHDMLYHTSKPHKINKRTCFNKQNSHITNTSKNKKHFTHETTALTR